MLQRTQSELELLHKKGGKRTYLLFGEGRLDWLVKFALALGTDLKQTVNPLISLQELIWLVIYVAWRAIENLPSE